MLLVALEYVLAKSHHEKDIKYQEYLDLKGLCCPLPILKTKLLLRTMKHGDVVLVEATDPHSTIDFEAYCARTGHHLLDSYVKDGKVFGFYIGCADLPSAT